MNRVTIGTLQVEHIATNNPGTRADASPLMRKGGSTSNLFTNDSCRPKIKGPIIHGILATTRWLQSCAFFRIKVSLTFPQSATPSINWHPTCCAQVNPPSLPQGTCADVMASNETGTTSEHIPFGSSLLRMQLRDELNKLFWPAFLYKRFFGRARSGNCWRTKPQFGVIFKLVSTWVWLEK